MYVLSSIGNSQWYSSASDHSAIFFIALTTGCLYIALWVPLKYVIGGIQNIGLTKGMVKHSSSARKFSPHFHKQSCPSLDPKTMK